MTKRFVTAAEMSLPLPGTRFVGEHPDGFAAGFTCQAFVHGYRYSRSRLTGLNDVAPGVSGLVHASPLTALFPTVVKVGAFVRGL
jgi:hypothetical protein